ncbi:hypothetical protein [Azospirillum palustre]
MNETAALTLIHQSFDAVNATLPAAERLSFSPDMILAGAGCGLDSLTVTSVFFEVESRLASEHGRSVDLFSAPFLTDPGQTMTARQLAVWVMQERLRP